MGIWCGDSKPPLNEFLEPLISELDDMLVNGISINGQNISVKFGRAPCDTPARSHMKSNKINTLHFHVHSVEWHSFSKISL